MRTLTFYSYKGGLGRTLTLAWCARALAKAGKRVFALDLDLEAPGLHYKLEPPDRRVIQSGFVDLLRSFMRGEPPPADLSAYVVPVEPEGEGSAPIHLMPAGAAPAAAYWQRLGGLSWQELFYGPEPLGARFFAQLKRWIEAQYQPDFLLVDARTGVTEMGGASLVLLADDVICLFGGSLESWEGARAVLREAQLAPRPAGAAPLRILPVLARLPRELPADRAYHRRVTLQRYLNEEAEDLAATLSVEHPSLVRSEPGLQVDERAAFDLGQPLAVHEDYRAIYAWVTGEAVSESAAAPVMETEQSAALAALQEEVGLYRRLAALRPDEHQGGLAASLLNLGGRLSDLGRREEGLRALQEAVESYRRLALVRPWTFEPDLAISLLSCGIRLVDLGRSVEGLTAFHEAVGLHRKLASAQPQRFESALARSLYVLGIQLSSTGQRLEALSAFQEAVDLFRHLTQSQPEHFLSDLANGLNYLRQELIALDRWEEAHSFAQEAVAIHRHLVHVSPDRFAPELARSLIWSASVLNKLGRFEEARPSAQEAVAHYNNLVLVRLDSFEADLARSHLVLAMALAALDRRSEAKTASAAAVGLFRSLAGIQPHIYSEELANSLGGMGVFLETEGDHVAAASHYQEGAQLLLPSSHRWATAVRHVGEALLNGYVLTTRAAGVPPDPDLLAAYAALGLTPEVAVVRPEGADKG